jgi:hypothetical protein
MGPGDANIAGNVHGGVIMHICDEVAGIAAVRHSGHRAVTAAMDRMNFLHPVFVGRWNSAALVRPSCGATTVWRSGSGSKLPAARRPRLRLRAVEASSELVAAPRRHRAGGPLLAQLHAPRRGELHELLTLLGLASRLHEEPAE